jgi:hypothetical protein
MGCDNFSFYFIIKIEILRKKYETFNTFLEKISKFCNNNKLIQKRDLSFFKVSSVHIKLNYFRWNKYWYWKRFCKIKFIERRNNWFSKHLVLKHILKQFISCKNSRFIDVKKIKICVWILTFEYIFNINLFGLRRDFLIFWSFELY